MSHIHVSCRVRPQNANEKKHGGHECVTIVDGKAIEITHDEGFATDYLKYLCPRQHAKPNTLCMGRCTFDRVFAPHATQQQVYEATAQPLVVDFLDGYNCTVFAYGQTGSGKTHTIYGPKDGVVSKPEEQGLIGRLVHDLYRQIAEQQSDQVSFELSASFMEIYMEQINDLLHPASKNLKVRENTDKGVYVYDLLAVRAPTKDQMLKLVERGNTNRVVGSTRMNNDSSRSHTVLMIQMVQQDVVAGSEKRATMYIVDLAGSEMVNKTLATGKTLNEAKAINKSLSALSNVIKALVDEKKHIPFRDSKLTRILQDSLGGHAKTCLIVTVSSSTYNVAETISTLRFGMRAKEIKNDPTQHKDAVMCDYQQVQRPPRDDNAQLFSRQLYQNLLLQFTQTQNELKAVLVQASQAKQSMEHQALNCHEEMSTSCQTDEFPSSVDDAEGGVAVHPLSTGDLETLVARSFDTPAAFERPRESKETQTTAASTPTRSGLTRTLTSLLFAEVSPSEDLRTKLDHATDELQRCRAETNALREVNVVLTAQNSIFSARVAELEGSMTTQQSEVDALKEINRTICAQNTALSDRNQELEALLEDRQPKPSSSLGGVVHEMDQAGGLGGGNGGDDAMQHIETLSRRLVEMKLHVHYVTEYTKSILDREPYELVAQMTQLKLENERLRFEEHQHAETVKTLQAKCHALAEAVAKNDDNAAALQKTIQEYQALYKEQVRLSQERQDNLVKEVEYYKMIWQRVSSHSPRSNNQMTTTDKESSSSAAASLLRASSFTGTVPSEPLSLMSLKRNNRTIVKPLSSKSCNQAQSPIHHIKAKKDANAMDPLSSVFELDLA
ncbi:unnamed protein product [Aphanomyces euteiches]